GLVAAAADGALDGAADVLDGDVGLHDLQRGRQRVPGALHEVRVLARAHLDGDGRVADPAVHLHAAVELHDLAFHELARVQHGGRLVRGVRVQADAAGEGALAAVLAD